MVQIHYSFKFLKVKCKMFYFFRADEPKPFTEIFSRWFAEAGQKKPPFGGPVA
jgi:hypothetical protein